MTTEKLLTRKELADVLGCSPATLHRWEKNGKLRPIRLGPCSVRYAKADVEAFIQNATEGKPPRC